MIVTLKSYLADLEERELAKPREQRREVPSMAALARAAGVHPMTLSRWVTGETKTTNHEIVAVIIEELRGRGFNTSLSDIVAYRQPSDQVTA